MSAPTSWKVEPAGTLRGELVVNGDKSVSHRALLVGALCDGPVRVRGFGASADTLATLDAVRALGVQVDGEPERELVVHGRGVRGLVAPAEPLDVRNSGTLLRLLAGVVAGQPAGRFTLDGDASIRRRPVDRVARPLAEMGATVSSHDGLPPLVIEAGAPLRGIRYAMPVASAQVKSCVLLAGLNATGATTVVEPRPTRDHTERILRAAGARVHRAGPAISVEPASALHLETVEVPGDFSSAAFFIVAATLLPESRIVLRGVGMGPGRTGLLDVLERMGARIGVFDRRTTGGGEPVADIEVQHAELVGTDVGPDDVAAMVDELPILALAACTARGRTTVRGADELRVKESDRIASTRAALWGLGARIDETDDGWRIRGVPSRLRGGTVDPRGDHRIAMLGAIAGLWSEQGVRVQDPTCIDVSFPRFREILPRAVGSEWS